jgi:hypothetical protein
MLSVRRGSGLQFVRSCAAAVAIAGLLVASAASAAQTPSKVALTVKTIGSGTVRAVGRSFTCHAKSCRHTFLAPRERRIVITASAKKGWKLKTWSRPCRGASRACSLRLKTRRSVTVTFVPHGSAPGSQTVTYPASYYTGPLGQHNILPPTGAFLGIWGTTMTQATHLESYVGRKLDILGAFYNSAAGTCYRTAPFSDGKPQAIYDHGAIPIVTWSPGYRLDQINKGSADACIRDVANRAKAFGHLFMLRPYHEFNGDWMIYSGCGQPFIDAWRRTVSIFQQQGATNVAWVYPPDEGYRTCAEQSYPGDRWVDWVATSSYNHDTSTDWCGYHTGWCEFSDMFHSNPSVSLHDHFGPHKPIMFTEIGSVEDPSMPGRKGNWFRNLGSTMKKALAYGRGVVYFDHSTTHYDWRIDTSQSSLNGFRDLAQDPYFNTRS